MSALKEFRIIIVSLKNGEHIRNFKINNKFFENFEYSEVTEGDLDVVVNLTKSEKILRVGVLINGSVQLICDRTNDEFSFPINRNDTIIFKYDTHYEEIDETLIHIPHDFQEIDMSNFIYEFISISIPMKKLRPDLAALEEEDDEDEEVTFVYSSEEDETEEEEEKEIDPRWSKLLNLKSNNK